MSTSDRHPALTPTSAAGLAALALAMAPVTADANDPPAYKACSYTVKKEVRAGTALRNGTSPLPGRSGPGRPPCA